MGYFTSYSIQMGILSFISKRSVTVQDWLRASFFGIQSTKSGQGVTPDSALNVSVVQACVRVLSETIASLPLHLYMQTKDVKNIARNNPLYALLHDRPNEHQTSFEFWEMVVGHILLRGNFYAFKEYNGGGAIQNLIPLHPDRMNVALVNNVPEYTYTPSPTADMTAVKAGRIPADLIWHIKDASIDGGVTGASRITLAREAVGISMACEEHGARFFSNGSTPGGVLTTPGKLSEDARAALKKSWNEAHQGGSNAFKVALLEGGLDWKAIGISNEDAQFLETRQFQIEEIARIFRVPGMLIGYTGDKSATFASAEQFMLSYVVHTIRPWCVRLEKSINKNLLTEQDRKKLFAEFQLAALLRGDLASRYSAYATARQWGWLSVNDIRQLENLNPIDNGNTYLQPINMQEAGVPPPAAASIPDTGGTANG